jgi:hypothetical protein
MPNEKNSDCARWEPKYRGTATFVARSSSELETHRETGTVYFPCVLFLSFRDRNI